MSNISEQINYWLELSDKFDFNIFEPELDDKKLKELDSQTYNAMFAQEIFITDCKVKQTNNNINFKVNQSDTEWATVNMKVRKTLKQLYDARRHNFISNNK